MVLRNSVVAQLGALAVIDCHGGKRFKYGVDADEGWMLGVLTSQAWVWLDIASRCPSFRANRMRTVSSPRSSTRIVTLTSKWRPTVLVRLPPGGRYEIEERQALCDVASWPEHENQVRQYLS